MNSVLRKPRSPVVDTHFHMWQLDKFPYKWPRPKEEEVICKDHLASDYEQERANTSIDNAMFVEVVESLEETSWALEVADENDFIKGVVGFVDLTSPDVENQLQEFVINRKFVGVRKILDFCEDPRWLERDDVMRGMRALQRHNLTYDLLIRTQEQYESAKRFIQLAPTGLKIIINHLGKPDAKNGATQAWYDDITIMAAHSNVYCKLSGMVTEADWNSWKASDFRAHVHHVIKVFGPDRIMFGSDWPVCKLAGANLASVYHLLDELVEQLSDDEKEKLFGANAIKCYNLNV